MLKQHFYNQTNNHPRLSAFLVVLTVAAIGTYLIIFSHAATPYASINADKGTLAGGATKQTCGGANDGNCVVFGRSVSNTTPKMIGINGTYSSDSYVQDAHNLGVQWMRVEQWGDNASYDTVPSTLNRLDAQGIHMLPLVNNYSVSWVTSSGRQQWTDALVHTAVTYGKGGTFWHGKTDMGSPVIEVGNEVYGNWYHWPDQGWLYPGDYAQMLKQAAIAVNSATNGQVKLLASVSTDYYDTFDSSWHHWAQDMKSAVPDLESYIGGVVSHAYGDIASIGVCVNNPCHNDPHSSHQSLYTIHSQWSVPVYITEIGQRAGSTTAGNGQVGYANQAAAMNYYFTELKNNSWEAGIFWYDQKDYQAYDSNGDNGWALIDNNDYRKPAWTAYQTQAAHFP